MKACSQTLILLFIALNMGCTQEEESKPSLTPIFEAQTIDAEVQIGYGVAIGHVNDDGKPDILLADKKQYAWYENGSWDRHVILEDLTARDNVAIAARDIDGDGLVEIAVGAMWNPGETVDASQSGSVHYLMRPDNPTDTWEPIQLHHEPTTHRMRWVKTQSGNYDLIVLPLHGVGNQGGEGEGVKVIAYSKPADPRDEWTMHTLDDQMHMTHNLDFRELDGETDLFIAGKEGVRRVSYEGQWPTAATVLEGLTHGAGEVRVGQIGYTELITTIEPLHGTHLVAYVGQENKQRVVLDTTFVQGHALAVGDLLDLGRDQIVAGWRNPNAEEKVGIKLFIPDESGANWTSHIIDDNTMACEDLRLADLNDDGLLDIIAAGRATNNLIIYWNKSTSL